MLLPSVARLARTIELRTITSRTILARASNKVGQTQTPAPLWNAAGYHHNAFSSVSVTVA